MSRFNFKGNLDLSSNNTYSNPERTQCFSLNNSNTPLNYSTNPFQQPQQPPLFNMSQPTNTKHLFNQQTNTFYNQSNVSFKWKYKPQTNFDFMIEDDNERRLKSCVDFTKELSGEQFES